MSLDVERHMTVPRRLCRFTKFDGGGPVQKLSKERFMSRHLRAETGDLGKASTIGKSRVCCLSDEVQELFLPKVSATVGVATPRVKYLKL